MADVLPATVPGPVAPADRNAWYAPTVRSQYHVQDGVVASVSEDAGSFRYRTRKPPLSTASEETRAEMEAHLADADVSRPRTREGAIERMDAGFPSRWQTLVERFGDHTPSERRRLAFHLNASLRGFDELTPLALDERIEVADTSGEFLSVHTRDFAPVETTHSADHPFLDRFLGERIASYPVSFGSFEVPVTIYRKHLLGRDTFDTAYAVDEPARLPGDDRLVADVADRIVESAPARVLDERFEFVRARSRTLLRRRLLLEGPSSGLDTIRRTLRRVASMLGVANPPVESRTQEERIDALAYYVTRDLVGDGQLTIPIRDERIRSIEANRVGERIKVVPHRDTRASGTRMPASLSIDEADRFIALARKLAAEGGVELSTQRPSATVELARDGAATQSLQVAVGLPMVSETGPHISITKQPRDPPVPTELIEQGVLTPEIVATVWLLAEHRGSVLFTGPDGTEPANALAAHALFIPEQQRPVTVDSGRSTVSLPQETAITLARQPSTVRDGTEDATGTVERAALNPDVEIIPAVSSDRAYDRLGEALAAGRSVFAAARAATREVFVREGSERGVPPYLAATIDLVVDLPVPGASRPATGWLPVGVRDADATTLEREPEAESAGLVRWQRLDPDADEDGLRLDSLIETLCERSEHSEAELRAAYERRKRYVSYLREESVTDRDALMGFLADLRTDEAATIERIRTASER